MMLSAVATLGFHRKGLGNKRRGELITRIPGVSPTRWRVETWTGCTTIVYALPCLVGLHAHRGPHVRSPRAEGALNVAFSATVHLGRFRRGRSIDARRTIFD